MSEAEQRAAPGFAEFRFDDGALIQVSAYGGTVSVLQMQASTQGRGAAFLSVEQADDLATAISAAAEEAQKQRDAQPARAATAEPQPVPNVVTPAASAGLTAQDIANIVRATMAEENAKKASS